MQPQDFWQNVEPPGAADIAADAYPATFADGRLLWLPIRPLPDGVHGLASLIVNQASFAVVEALAQDLATRLAALRVEIVVGLPTLGLTLASAVAARLGHTRYVPLGTSRKFWYREALSTPLTSITTPDQTKRLYIDPRLPPLLEGRRVALIDDVVSSGTSMAAGLRLLEACGVEPVAIGAAMLQTERWRAALDPRWVARVHGVFATPLLVKRPDGEWDRAP